MIWQGGVLLPGQNCCGRKLWTDGMDLPGLERAVPAFLSPYWSNPHGSVDGAAADWGGTAQAGPISVTITIIIRKIRRHGRGGADSPRFFSPNIEQMFLTNENRRSKIALKEQTFCNIRNDSCIKIAWCRCWCRGTRIVANPPGAAACPKSAQRKGRNENDDGKIAYAHKIQLLSKRDHLRPGISAGGWAQPGRRTVSDGIGSSS